MIGSGQWPHLFPCSYHPLFFAQIKISNSINFSWAVTHKTTTESMILAKLPLWNKNYAKIWCMPYWSWNFVWWLLRWDNIFCCPHPNWLIKLEMSQINWSEHNKDDWGPQWTSVDPLLAFIVECISIPPSIPTACCPQLHWTNWPSLHPL